MCRPGYGTLRSQENLIKKQLSSSVHALHQGDSSPGQGNKKGFYKRSINRMFRTLIWVAAKPRQSLPQSGEKGIRTEGDNMF